MKEEEAMVLELEVSSFLLCLSASPAMPSSSSIPPSPVLPEIWREGKSDASGFGRDKVHNSLDYWEA